jgi:DNA-binding LytR/AlgR family response regulator
LGVPFKTTDPCQGEARREPPTALLKGHDMLLVEDSLIVALDAEDILTRLGVAGSSTAATVEGAFDCIEARRPSVAMLGINLGGRASFAVADRLAELGVPFLFAAGHGEEARLPDNHADVPVVQKPYTFENIASAMAKLVRPRNDA